MIGRATIYRTDPDARAMRILGKLDPEPKAAVVAALLELVCPITNREVDRGLGLLGVSRSRRPPLKKALFDACDMVLVKPRFSLAADGTYRVNSDGRASAIINRLDPAFREVASAALSELNKPLTVREIDVGLAITGIPRSKRRPIIHALNVVCEVVCIVPRR